MKRIFFLSFVLFFIFASSASATGNFYYVNAATGNDVACLIANSPANPCSTITTALTLSGTNDTISVAAGTYAETVVITTDSTAIVGADSRTVIIDPPGSASTAGIYGIYATIKTGLFIQNIGITGAYDGIKFDNVDSSMIWSDSTGSCGHYGMYLLNSSDANVVQNCEINGNLNRGLWLDDSDFNIIRYNEAMLNANDGFRIANSSLNNKLTRNNSSYNFDGGVVVAGSSSGNAVTYNSFNYNFNGVSCSTSDNNVFDTNYISFNNFYGMTFSASVNAEIGGNTIFANGQKGINVANNSHNMIVDTNSIDSNTAYGIQIDNSNSCVVINNKIDSNADDGFHTQTGSVGTVLDSNIIRYNLGSGIGIVASASQSGIIEGNYVAYNAQEGIKSFGDQQTIMNNVSYNNRRYGFSLSSASSVVKNNMADSNLFSGFYIQNGDVIIKGNLSRHNKNHGFLIDIGATNFSMSQNTSDSNDQYQFYFASASVSGANAKAFNHNNGFSDTPSRMFFNNAGALQPRRCYWDTTDELVIQNAIGGVFDTATNFIPYRFAQIDTRNSGDSTAPDTVAVFTATTSGANIDLSWTNASINEDANGGAVGQAGVRIYRLINRTDTTDWHSAFLTSVAFPGTSYSDASVSAGNTAYYRLTTFDTATYPNESFFTDTKFATVASAQATAGNVTARRAVGSRQISTGNMSYDILVAGE